MGCGGEVRVAARRREAPKAEMLAAARADSRYAVFLWCFKAFAQLFSFLVAEATARTRPTARHEPTQPRPLTRAPRASF